MIIIEHIVAMTLIMATTFLLFDTSSAFRCKQEKVFNALMHSIKNLNEDNFQKRDKFSCPQTALRSLLFGSKVKVQSTRSQSQFKYKDTKATLNFNEAVIPRRFLLRK